MMCHLLSWLEVHKDWPEPEMYGACLQQAGAAALHTGSLPCHSCLALPSASDIPHTPPPHILPLTQDMRTPLAVTLATNVIHLVLSLLFIFPGHWGVTGAAASTSIAEWLAAATYLALGWGRRQELGLDPWPQMDVKKAWKQYLPFLQVRWWGGNGDRAGEDRLHISATQIAGWATALPLRLQHAAKLKPLLDCMAHCLPSSWVFRLLHFCTAGGRRGADAYCRAAGHQDAGVSGRHAPGPGLHCIAPSADAGEGPTTQALCVRSARALAGPLQGKWTGVHLGVAGRGQA